MVCEVCSLIKTARRVSEIDTIRHVLHTCWLMLWVKACLTSLAIVWWWLSLWEQWALLRGFLCSQWISDNWDEISRLRPCTLTFNSASEIQLTFTKKIPEDHISLYVFCLFCSMELHSSTSSFKRAWTTNEKQMHSEPFVQFLLDHRPV